jgi:cytochrome b pre-mRNA-processing protein 3
LREAAKPVNQLARRCNKPPAKRFLEETAMFKRLFGGERHANRAITDALYGQIVAAARQPVFYSDWSVPDTPLGRFEMLSLHMFLFQHRLRGEAGISGEIAQVLIDEFFTDLDHSLRELGIGDAGVPKRMKKLARMFYGRTSAYADALEAGDRVALAAALARNVRPESGKWPQADALAGYAIEAHGGLARQPSVAIHGGVITFPEPLPGNAAG